MLKTWQKRWLPSNSHALTKVAIIGAGPLGRWLALAAARAGYNVLLEDVMPANLHHAREALRQQLGPANLPNVEFVSTIEDAVRDVDLAIDCVPDELESKLEILWLLDRMAPPRTVLVTPTTHLSLTDLAACTYRPSKCIAIAADARDLVARELSWGESAASVPGNVQQVRVEGSELLLRTTAQTTAETVTLVEEFWKGIGLEPRFELEQVS
jgi:3-hydroxybutyryl-CoA dehydrogenase